MVTRLLLLLVGLVAALPAWAQASLRVDTDELEVGQRARASVVVVDARPSGIPRLEVPEGLDVRYASQQQSRRKIGLSVTRIWEFTYWIHADQEGTFELGPATVDVGGQTVATGTIEVQVTPRQQVPSDPIQVHAEVSDGAVWEGQVVLYTYGVRSRHKLMRVRWVQLPLDKLDGLVRPRDGGRRHKEYVIDDPDSPIWVQETIEPFIVTGTEDLVLPPAVSRVEVPKMGDSERLDPFGLLTRTESHALSTDMVDLAVRRLPPPPPGFTGLVGDFEVESEIAATDVAVGDSVDWRLRITGDGTLEGFTLPPPVDLEGARIYDGSPAVDAEVTERGYRARGLYGRVVVPTQPGTLQLPPLDIVTFSPSRGEYVTHRIAQEPLRVAPGAEGSAEVRSFAPETPEVETREEGDGLHEIYRSGRAHAPPLIALLPAGMALGGGLILFTLLGEGLETWQRRRVAARPSGPPPPRQRMARLPDDPGARLVTLDEVVRQALAQHLGVAPSDLDRRAVADRLPEALRDRVQSLVDALDRARFAEEAPGRDLEARVLELVDALEQR